MYTVYLMAQNYHVTMNIATEGKIITKISRLVDKMMIYSKL